MRSERKLLYTMEWYTRTSAAMLRALHGPRCQTNDQPVGLERLNVVLFHLLMFLAEESSLSLSLPLSLSFPLSLSVSVLLTQLVWNVQMFPFGNGRPALFTHTHTHTHTLVEREEKGEHIPIHSYTHFPILDFF